MNPALKDFPFGPCPECGRALYVDADAEGQPTCVGHADPPCAKFDETDASPFLLWVLDVREAARRGVGEA